MQSDDSHQKYGIKLFKRRLSLMEKQQWEKNVTQRQELRNRYQQYLQQRRKSIQEYPFSPQSTSIGKGEYVNNSMPSIRKFRQEKQKIGEALRQTISKYNYINNQKQKQLQNLNRKKMKYQRVMKIRQDHIRQKMSLNQSRAMLQKETEGQKLRLKKSVDVDKVVMGHSRIRSIMSKKYLGDERRAEESKNKSQIQSNNSKDFESRKKLYESIASQKKQLKRKKQSVNEQRKKMGTEHYYRKIYGELDKIQFLQKKQKTARSKFSQKVEQLQKSKQLLDEKMKNYEYILLDGSTLKKPKPQLKLSCMNSMKRSELTSNRIKTESNSDDIFY